MSENTKHLEVATNVQALVEQLLCYEGAIAVPYGLLSENPYDVFTVLLLDRPELMHVEGLFDIAASPRGCMVLHVRYSLGQHETLKRLGDMEKATAKLAQSCADSSYEEKIRLARDWLLDNAVLVAKDLQETDNGYAPIVYGLGSPTALIEAFQYLMRRLGVVSAPSFGINEIMNAQAPRNPWIDVYKPADRPGEPTALLGCVDIVGDALRTRTGKPVGAVLHEPLEMAELYGTKHKAVGAYRALYEDAR